MQRKILEAKIEDRNQKSKEHYNKEKECQEEELK